VKYLLLSLCYLFACQNKFVRPVCFDLMEEKYKFYASYDCDDYFTTSIFFSEEQPIYLGVFFENGDTLAYTEKKDLEWPPATEIRATKDSAGAILQITIEENPKLFDKIRELEISVGAGLPDGKGGIKHLRACIDPCTTSAFIYLQTVMWAHTSFYSDRHEQERQKYLKKYKEYKSWW
jgi:hypothetical protein